MSIDTSTEALDMSDEHCLNHQKCPASMQYCADCRVRGMV